MLAERPLPEDLADRIDALSLAWSGDPDLAAIYLFGSRAGGRGGLAVGRRSRRGSSQGARRGRPLAKASCPPQRRVPAPWNGRGRSRDPRRRSGTTGAPGPQGGPPFARSIAETTRRSSRGHPEALSGRGLPAPRPRCRPRRATAREALCPLIRWSSAEGCGRWSGHCARCARCAGVAATRSSPTKSSKTGPSGMRSSSHKPAPTSPCTSWREPAPPLRRPTPMR